MWHHHPIFRGALDRNSSIAPDKQVSALRGSSFCYMVYECVCVSQCVAACIVVVGRLEKHCINTGRICVPYLSFLQSDRLLLFLQPSQLLWNWRHLEDPQHPSTGIRPASLVWAKAYWEREVLTASVFCTNTHSCSFCLEYACWQELNQTVNLPDKQYAQHGLEIRDLCVLASLSPTVTLWIFSA